MVDDSGLKIESAINLFLRKEEIIRRATFFAKKNKSHKSISDEDFIEKMLYREKRRLSLINEIERHITVANIDAECTQEEIEKRILREIKNDFDKS